MSAVRIIFKQIMSIIRFGSIQFMRQRKWWKINGSGYYILLNACQNLFLPDIMCLSKKEVRMINQRSSWRITSCIQYTPYYSGHIWIGLQENFFFRFIYIKMGWCNTFSFDSFIFQEVKVRTSEFKFRVLQRRFETSFHFNCSSLRHIKAKFASLFHVCHFDDYYELKMNRVNVFWL